MNETSEATALGVDLGGTKGIFIAMVIGAGVFAFAYFYKRSRKMRQFIDRMSLKIPIVGQILHNSAIARFATAGRASPSKLQSVSPFIFAQSSFRPRGSFGTTAPFLRTR